MNGTLTNMNEKCITDILGKLKEGQRIELNNSGKIFTKMGGLLVTPVIADYNWMKSQVSSHLFDRHIARIVFVSAGASAGASACASAGASACPIISNRDK